MKRTFSNTARGREVIVDDDGISLRRGVSLAAFIPWEQLERLDPTQVRSRMGVKISVPLERSVRREFYQYASEIWRCSFPERWQRDRKRTIRAGAWAIYFWLPLLMLGPCVAFYILFWVRGSPEHLREGLQKMNRIAALSLVCVVTLALWYAYKIRHAAPPGAALNRRRPEPPGNANGGSGPISMS